MAVSAICDRMDQSVADPLEGEQVLDDDDAGWHRAAVRAKAWMPGTRAFGSTCDADDALRGDP